MQGIHHTPLFKSLFYQRHMGELPAKDIGISGHDCPGTTGPEETMPVTDERRQEGIVVAINPTSRFQQS